MPDLSMDKALEVFKQAKLNEILQPKIITATINSQLAEIGALEDNKDHLINVTTKKDTLLLDIELSSMQKRSELLHKINTEHPELLTISDTEIQLLIKRSLDRNNTSKEISKVLSYLNK